MRHFKNCNHCSQLIILNEFKVDKKVYKKSVFIVYDELKKIYCSLLCKMNGGK